MRNFTRKRNLTSAVSAILVAVIVVVVVVVAGVGGYLVLMSPAAPSSSSSASSSSVAQISSVASSSSSSTSLSSNTSLSTSSSSSVMTTSSNSSSSIGSSLNLGYNFSSIYNVKNLLGNFSQMEIKATYSNGSQSGSGNETLSFTTIGHPTISGVPTDEINYTFSGTANGTSHNESFLVYYSTSNYSAVLATYQGQNLTGFYAGIFTGAVVGFFALVGGYQDIINATVLSQFQNTGTSSATYGALTMQVTTYTASNVVIKDVHVDSITVKTGQVPNTSLTIIPYVTGQETVNGTTVTFTLQLVSATPVT